MDATDDENTLLENDADVKIMSNKTEELMLCHKKIFDTLRRKNTVTIDAWLSLGQSIEYYKNAFCSDINGKDFLAICENGIKVVSVKTGKGPFKVFRMILKRHPALEV